MRHVVKVKGSNGRLSLVNSVVRQRRNMKLLLKAVQNAVSPRDWGRRNLWGWLNAVFNKVDYERIKAVGPDRAAAEWLLRCGAKVRFQGLDRFQHDYNLLPTGPLGRYKIQAIDATESCIMYRGFDHLDGLKHLEEIKFNKCIYIEDTCLERLSSIESLQESLNTVEVVSCGNVTDRGIIALHKLRNLEHLFVSDLPGIKDQQATANRLQTALPHLDIVMDLD
ncbi:ATP synthase subunit s, mitochondrial isoform X1 [Solea solea]|uniref:ATP synthase subunit s, mitochondrial isoform X1 n=2 Tax=Solea solea TaxID=90069 RepID=UPI00272DC3ED|nr:ATP synthase subunit s, mitochondrial isoform X1 [Solea solea]